MDPRTSRPVAPPFRTSAMVSALALATLVAACGSDESQDTLLEPLVVQDPATVFLVQDRVPEVVMEALFQGEVREDAAGCLRLRFDDDDGPTVIWPVDFRLQDDRVLSGGGAEVGRVGGTFHLGGGVVSTLHDGLPVSDAETERARTRCPGDYWIVGEIPGL